MYNCNLLLKCKITCWVLFRISYSSINFKVKLIEPQDEVVISKNGRYFNFQNPDKFIFPGTVAFIQIIEINCVPKFNWGFVYHLGHIRVGQGYIIGLDVILDWVDTEIPLVINYIGFNTNNEGSSVFKIPTGKYWNYSFKL